MPPSIVFAPFTVNNPVPSKVKVAAAFRNTVGQSDEIGLFSVLMLPVKPEKSEVVPKSIPPLVELSIILISLVVAPVTIPSNSTGFSSLSVIYVDQVSS